MEQIGLADIKEDAVRGFTFVIQPAEGDDIQLRVDGEPRTIFLVNANQRGYSLRWITVTGKGEIKVSQIPLKTGRLGDVDVNFAYGEGKVGDRDALLVVTEEGKGQGQLTVRIRPEDGQGEGKP